MLQAHTWRMLYLYLLLFYGNNGYANAPVYYVMRTSPVLLWVLLELFSHPRLFNRRVPARHRPPVLVTLRDENAHSATVYAYRYAAFTCCECHILRGSTSGSEYNPCCQYVTAILSIQWLHVTCQVHLKWGFGPYKLEVCFLEIIDTVVRRHL